MTNHFELGYFGEAFDLRPEEFRAQALSRGNRGHVDWRELGARLPGGAALEDQVFVPRDVRACLGDTVLHSFCRTNLVFTHLDWRKGGAITRVTRQLTYSGPPEPGAYLSRWLCFCRS